MCRRPGFWPREKYGLAERNFKTDLNLAPRGIDHEVPKIMHCTLYGVDADPVNLLLHRQRGDDASQHSGLQSVVKGGDDSHSFLSTGFL